MGPAAASAFVKDFLSQSPPQEAWVGIAPPFTSLERAKEAAGASTLQIGAQNVNPHEKGAFTGEISTDMLKEVGASFVILGHSERRHLFGEGDALIHDKLARAVSVNLRPVLCIGETLDERVGGQTESVLERQLSSALKGLEPAPNLIIAYEPVWAIGTGKVASPEMAQETHEIVRKILATHLGEKGAQACPILYGGSVKPENAKNLLSQPDIDGALIGGASLDVASFTKIIEASL